MKKVKEFIKKIKKPQLNKTGMIIVGIAILLGLIYYYKGLFLAAVVNGKPITRLTVIQKLEKRDGKQVLDNLITETLINQEAQKMKVKVTPGEINAELTNVKNNLKESGQDLDKLLALQGMSTEEFKRQIELQKTIEKILGDKINATDDEVNQYIEQNKETFPKDYNPDEMKKTVKLQLEQQKLSEEFQKWLDLAKTKANINYIVKYL